MPTEPNHVITLSVPSQSVAMTSDGNLGFFALTGGNVAMFDIPGKQLSNTCFVGGTPRFIITGLYPPASPANGIAIPILVLSLIVALALMLLLGRRCFVVARRRRTQAVPQT
jgi:hypothetical protein